MADILSVVLRALSFVLQLQAAGAVFFAAAFGPALTISLTGIRSLARTTALLAILAVALGMGVGRMGCLLTELPGTPTGSSWINQVERWFGFLTDQKIRRGAHRSVQALEADIRSWIADWNTHPRPFIWTKTAEEILDSLARFCRRISGAGH